MLMKIISELEDAYFTLYCTKLHCRSNHLPGAKLSNSTAMQKNHGNLSFAHGTFSALQIKMILILKVFSQ